MQTLDVGEVATIDTQWYDGSGDPAEPSAITLTVIDPNGGSTAVAKAAMTGSSTPNQAVPVLDVWSYSFVVSVAGVERYDVEGVVDGDPVKLPSGQFLVGADERVGPCEPWCRWDEVEACGATDFSGLDTAQRESLIDTASGIMFDLDRRFYTGICEVTRPLCLACARCAPSVCSCADREAIDLGGRLPIWGAWGVTVDGVELAQSAYTVTSRRYLVRIDGNAWPRGSAMSDPDAFRASWAYGRRVPPGGRRAAALFVAEMGKSCIGTACQLPQRVSQINREGVTYTIIDSMKMIEEGRTGVYLVDLWIAADLQGRHVHPGGFSPMARTLRRG